VRPSGSEEQSDPLRGATVELVIFEHDAVEPEPRVIAEEEIEDGARVGFVMPCGSAVVIDEGEVDRCTRCKEVSHEEVEFRVEGLPLRQLDVEVPGEDVQV
jgi:hypothetical protein